MDGRDYVVRDNPDERPYELLRDGELVDETLPAEKGVTFSPVQTTEACHLQVSFLAQAPTWLFRFVSMDVARGRAATRVPQMCPECVRAFSKQTTTKYRFAGTLRKPSDGLEPSTLLTMEVLRRYRRTCAGVRGHVWPANRLFATCR
jgi:hypothetical protein